MIEVTYKCDRCQAIIELATYRDVEIRVEECCVKRVGWCDDCVRVTGLLPLVEQRRKALEARGMAIPSPLTIDELVRKIVREEVGNAS